MFNESKEVVQHFLEETKWDYQFIEDRDTFEVMCIKEDSPVHNHEILITIDDSNMLFYTFLFFEDELSDKGEFFKMLNKINLNIENAQFIYNAEINGMECRSHIFSYDIIPSFEMIEDSFNAVKRLAEKFSAVIKNVAEGKYLTQPVLEALLYGESNDGVVY